MLKHDTGGSLVQLHVLERTSPPMYTATNNTETDTAL